MQLSLSSATFKPGEHLKQSFTLYIIKYFILII